MITAENIAIKDTFFKAAKVKRTDERTGRKERIRPWNYQEISSGR